MEKEQKKVSIILPTYNGSKYIAQAIKSFLNQKYSNIELVIVDDGSTDGVDAIINRHRDKRIIYVKHEKNMGLSAALNTGFALSSGDFLTWQSDDNFFHEKAIEKMVAFLQKHKDIFFVYSNFYLIDEEGRILKSFKVGSPKTLDIGNRIGSCFLYRREVYKKIGEYDPELYLAEDYNYWLRIREHFKMKKINDFLAYYRMHKNSLTSLNEVKQIAQQMEKASNGYVPISAKYWHQGYVFFHKALYRKSRKALLKSLFNGPFYFQVWKTFLFVNLKIMFPSLANKILKIARHPLADRIENIEK